MESTNRSCRRLLKSALARVTLYTARKKRILYFIIAVFAVIILCHVHLKLHDWVPTHSFRQNFMLKQEVLKQPFTSMLSDWYLGTQSKQIRVRKPQSLLRQFFSPTNGETNNLTFLNSKTISKKISESFYNILSSKSWFNSNKTVFYFNSSSEFYKLLDIWQMYSQESSPQELNFTINHEGICAKQGYNLTLLIAVTSSVSHAESRLAIRETWASYAKQKGAKLLFFVGIPTQAKYRARLAQEDLKFHDIIQGNFLDTYANLTLKTLGILKWVSEFCSMVKYTLKVDDDVFINVENIFNVTEKNRTRTILGQLAHEWPPVRNPKSKWYAPYSSYPFNTYPDFVFGPSYILTGDSMKILYETSFQVPFFHLEDVHITGLVSEKAKIKRVSQIGMFNTPRDLRPCSYQNIISSHGHTPPDMKRHWMWLKRKDFKCSPE